MLRSVFRHYQGSVDDLGFLAVQEKDEAGRGMIFALGTSSLARLKQGMAFRAEPESGEVLGDAVCEDEVEPLRTVPATASRANALVVEAVEEKRIAFVAEAPIVLRARTSGRIKRQLHPCLSAAVSATCDAVALVGKAVEIDRAAFGARRPPFLYIRGAGSLRPETCDQDRACRGEQVAAQARCRTGSSRLENIGHYHSPIR